MNENSRIVKRSKSSRSKELEENDEDEDDSERRKPAEKTIRSPEVNRNTIDEDQRENINNLLPLGLHNEINRHSKYDGNDETIEHFKVYGICKPSYKYRTCSENERLDVKSDENRYYEELSDENIDNNKTSCCGGRTMRGKRLSECEYWKRSLADEVRSSYWHCSEVENYPGKHNSCSPCTEISHVRTETTGDSNGYCAPDCIYLPFENVTNEKSCFRRNCGCNQRYAPNSQKAIESKGSTKTQEILLLPSTLPRSKKTPKECFCIASSCCEDISNEARNYYVPQNQSTYRRDKKTCGSRENKKSNHFKDKVNQVLPDVMASVVLNKRNLPESQSGGEMTQPETRLANGVSATSCDNCNEYNNVTSHVPEPNHTNSLVPKCRIVPENSVPFLNVNSVSSSSNNLHSLSNHVEQSDYVGLDRIIVSEVETGRKNAEQIEPEEREMLERETETKGDCDSSAKFLSIEIKLNQDGSEEQAGSCITESLSEEILNSSKSIPSFKVTVEKSVTENDTSGDKGEILEVHKLMADNLPTSSKYLTSPFRNTRKKPRDQRPKSVPEKRVRKQFYTPYEEALSSLLWQPYDCRNNALANMELSDVSDREDQNKRSVHRSRRKSGAKSTKPLRQENRLVGSSSMHSYALPDAFDYPPGYGEIGGYQSLDLNQFFSGCDPNLLCRNCKINLFVEDNDEFRGQYFCFNCKELKRFLSENNTMTDEDILQHMNFGQKSYGSLDGACGGAPATISSVSGSVLGDQLVPNFYFHNQTRKPHSKHKHANEPAPGKRARQNQDNDTCSSTLSSTYSSTSSLSSLESPPRGAPVSTSSERSGSGTQPTQFSEERCRNSVDLVQTRENRSDTFASNQAENSKPRYTNNVDSKMLVNISNNHNLSLSQSNLLSTSSNNLVSVVSNNPSSSSCDNINSENLVNIVSCYRAVPVHTSPSALPTNENQNNNHVPHVSNNNPTTSNPIFSQFSQNGGGSGQGKSRCVSSVSVPGNTNGLPPPPGVAKPLATTSRTFISTEAQTDEIILNRDQRRRERRERRQQRRLAQQLQQWPSVPPEIPADRLPDILHSHVPPPYSTLPLGAAPCSSSLPPSLSSPPSLMHPSLPNLPPSSHCGSPLHAPPSHASPVTSFAGIRFPFTIVPTGRRRSRLSRRGSGYTPEEEPKTCCGVSMTIRWFISIILVIGVLCVIIGCVLGTMHTGVRQHVSVSLLMIGVGIILVTVSGLAWRLSVYRDEATPTWRMLLGLGGSHGGTGEEGSGEPNRRFVPRLPPSYGRPHHPYAAMMYPEFQFRPPPPSYQASMQEYRLRLLLLDRQATPPNTVSPPPTYRSHSGSLLRAPPLSSLAASLGHATLPRPHFPPTPTPSLAPSHYTSRPPSYRSRPPSLHPGGPPSICHSRDSSDLSDSRGNVISVINTEGLLKLMEPPGESDAGPDAMLKMPTEPMVSSRDGTEEKKELVTVVTSSSTQVIVESVPCGLEEETSHTPPPVASQAAEMHILARL